MNAKLHKLIESNVRNLTIRKTKMNENAKKIICIDFHSLLK
jgi:hypothetical protein